MLGGPRRVVEIDEAFLTKRKYNVGRKLAKDDVIVFGMTELEGGPKRVEDRLLLQYLLEKESSRNDGETVHHDQAINDSLVITMQDGPIIGDIVDEETTQVVIGYEDDFELEEPEPEPEPVQPEAPSQPGTRPRFRMRTEYEQAEQRLFGPQELHFPKRTLLFVVQNRRAETLIPLVRQYVIPGTYVFSDKWMACWELRDGYEHFVVVNKKRFVQYHFS